MIVSGQEEEREKKRREMIILKSQSKPDERKKCIKKINNNDDDKNMHRGIYIHTKTAQTSTVITNNGIKNSKSKPESATQ